jgi:prepilin-type N-terminal cleavage/methylation domain-containing protein
MKQRVQQRGFTLIELLLVMGILSMVMATVVSNHSRFGGKVLLRTLTYDTALTIRQAQTYGISVRQSTTTSSQEFLAGYGVNFETSTPTSFRMFADTYSDGGVYTAGSDTVIQTYNIGRGYVISDLCVTNGPLSSPTANDYDCTTPNRIDLLFKRPEPDAEIRVNQVSGTLYPKAKIELRSPRGDIQSIIVEVSGQMSVQ